MSANNIFMLGPTGAGKSFLCNEIFKACGNLTTSFLSSSSIESTTKEIQSGTINYCNNTYTLLDFPGIYDASIESQTEVDAQNTCKLVKALQNCTDVTALIFCYIGPRFPLPLKVWYDRIQSIVAGYPNLSVLLLENKCTDEDNPEVHVKRNLELNQILGYPLDAPAVPYIRCKYYSPGMDAGNDVRLLLNKLQTCVPVKVSAPVVPEICYKETTEGPVFEEVISDTQVDKGHMVTTSRQERYREERMVHDGDLGKIFGFKKKVVDWKERTVHEQKWSPKMVTVRVVVQYKNIFKVRYDGTQDFDKKVEISRRTDES